MANAAQLDRDAAAPGTWVESVNMGATTTYPAGRRPKYLIVGTAGTIIVKNDPDGAGVTVTVPAGRVDLSPHEIAGGTATDVTAVF